MSSLVRFTKDDLLLFRKEATQVIFSERLKVLQKRWKARYLANKYFPEYVNPKNEKYWEIINKFEKTLHKK